jgi:hypothetical protein
MYDINFTNGVFVLYLSISFIIISLVKYWLHGFDYVVLVFWLLSIILASLFFYLSDTQKDNHAVNFFFDKKDIYIVVALILVFLPIYIGSGTHIPPQINTDEIAITIFARDLSSLGVDLFSLSTYFGFPTLVFAIFGYLASLFGEVNVFTMRIIHSLFGLAIISISYFFFRSVFEDRYKAILASIILGSQHALLAISKMGMRDNSALLLELFALLAFLTGFKRKSLFLTYLGGALSGLAYYIYAPGKIIILLWLAFLGVSFLFLQKSINPRAIFLNIFVSLIGFIMVLAPQIVSTINQEDVHSLSYQKEQILLFQEGRDLQMRWTSSENTFEGVKRNIFDGLTVFNRKLNDKGFIYPNYEHGFVDPITGIILWFGLITSIIAMRSKRKRKPEKLLILTSFTLLFLLFSFVITKTPNYTRMLIILPFVAYFFVSGSQFLISHLPSIFRLDISKNTKDIFLGIIVSIVVIMNINMFNDFVSVGLSNGDIVGNTAQYIISKKNSLNHNFYLLDSANQDIHYYPHGESYAWRDWMKEFIQENQQVDVVDPLLFIYGEYNVPGTLFMHQSTWLNIEKEISKKYSYSSKTNITPSGSHIAVEIIEKI